MRLAGSSTRAGNFSPPCWPVKDQRNPQGALINEVAVGFLPVFSQAFTVVGNEDDENLVQKLPPTQGIPEVADLLIDVLQLRVVTGAEACAVTGGKIVRRVKVVQMKEEEKRTAGVCFQPADRAGNHLRPQALDIARV